MADNVELPSGSGGAIIATDDDGVAQHQYVKLEFGADNTQTKVSTANPLPVVGASNSGVDIGDVTVNNGVGASAVPIQDGGNSITVDGTVAVTSAGITTIAGAVAGTEMQVDVLTMPTVTVNAHAVTNAGTFVVQENGAALTSLQLIDDTVQVLGTDTYTEASSKGITLGAVRRDADTTLVNATNEFGPLQMDANGRLKVEAFSGEALPVTLTSTTVTGTVAVTQSGTWDEVGINDSGNSITVDWAGTAPPIGAGLEVTALRVTVATDSTGVVSVDDNGSTLSIDDGGGVITVDGTVAVTNGGTFVVQENGAALTALQLIDDPIATLGTTTYTETTTKGMIIGAVRRDADTTLVDTTNEVSPLQVDANGRLKVEAFSGETLPVSGTVTANLAAGTNNIGDVDILSIAAGDNNIGNVDIVSLPASTNTIEVVGDAAHDAAIAGNPVIIGGVSSAAAPTSVSADQEAVRAWFLRNGAAATVLTAAGALIGGDASNGLDVDVTRMAALIAGSALIGDVGIQGRATGGLTIFKSIDIDESEEEVKATAGTLYSILAFNTTAAPLWLKFYNLTAANTTVGTSTPVITLMVPANADSDGAGFTHSVPQGYAFSTAISVACTTGVADADTGAPGANACVILLGYA